MKRNVCVVVTARPSYARVKTVLEGIRASSELELQLVVGASALLDKYGTAASFIEQDGFEIAASVHMVLEGENLATMAKTTGLGMLELATVFDNLKPDVVVTIADRYETLATAAAASYMNIPVAHIQGGEVTGSIDEKVRHAVTKLSNLHFVSTEKARERVVSMGEEPGTVFRTGCPSIDLARRVLDNPTVSFDPFERYGGVGDRIDLTGQYLVVMQHPVTTEYELSARHVTETLHAIREVDLPTVWFWPNVDAGSDLTARSIRIFRELERPTNVHFFKNMFPADFLSLLYNSSGLVGNSSVGIRECAFLGVPAVNIGSRQVGRARGCNVTDVAYNRREIIAAIQSNLKNGRCRQESLYGDGLAGPRIADLLSSVPLRVEKRLSY